MPTVFSQFSRNTVKLKPINQFISKTLKLKNKFASIVDPVFVRVKAKV